MTPRRPAVALRVGITGTRALSPDQQDALRPKLTALLNLVRAEVQRLAKKPAAQPAYATGAPPLLRFVSPLAEGADRLAADAAHDAGYQLFVPMPFAQADYEQDFHAPESRAEFRRMLAWADGATLELDGGRNDPAAGRYDEARSYEAVGRFVVRNCDLLIAIWDGKPGKGRGGTADIVRFATHVGPPVWWIEPDGSREPALIETQADLRVPEGLKRGTAADDGLKSLLRAWILPPAPPDEPVHGFLDRFVRDRKERRGTKDMPPLETYLCEPTPERCSWSWSKLHEFVMRRSAWAAQQVRHFRKRCAPAKPPEEPPQPHPPQHPPLPHTPRPTLPRHRARWAAAAAWQSVWPRAPRSTPRPSHTPTPAPRPDVVPADWWQTFYRDATERAGVYADRYRSSYVAIFLLGAWALSFAVLGLAAACLREWMAVLEMLSFGLILWLVHANHWHRWHQRWIEYRLLAELCRKQQALARLGWSLSTWEVRRMAQSGTREPLRLAWAAWFFNAVMRAAPLPRGDLSGAAVAAIRDTLLAAPVEEQRAYHRRRAQISLRAGQFFGYAGEGLFLLTLAVVLVKLAVMGVAAGWTALHLPSAGGGEGAAHWLGVAAGVVPALSAAFVGIRAYAELEVLAEQSTRMEAAMVNARRALWRIDPLRPLASQDLGMEVFDVATLMLQDVEGWVQLFQVKAVDTG